MTVMFCDLVDSTVLAAQLDPEDYRTIVQRYQQTCEAVIQRYDGYIAQYLGDGILVYFGYPLAHEEDAQRAVRVGLEIVTSLQNLSSRHEISSPSMGEGARGTQGRTPLRVRIGIHTGLVVVGEIGGGAKREHLALGETPNIAARIQSLAEPNTVMLSAATYRLIEGQFESQPFGSHLLKGITTPIAVYHVQGKRQNTSPLAGRTTLTPLVGREQEVGLLLDRWEQAKEERGQVILLSGEPGIGKSRLAYTLREQVTSEGSLLFEARCSPYHQHSAFYPLIDLLQRTLLFTRQDTDKQKVAKLEQTLTLYDMQDSLPLFTALLSLPTPSQYPPLNVTPQRQKERTLQALVQLLVAQAERQATVSVWEDLHWADPTSLEFLSLLVEQIPTTKLLLVLTFRPEFTPQWKPRSHISQLVLNRLGKKQVEEMIAKAAAGQELAADVVEQIRLKTDGVPLFIEELTKSVVESVTDVGARRAVPLQTIPTTLQEALLARLDRLSDARQIAQLGATLGREFSHELLQAVAPLSETDLHTALTKLVEAEILYQRGVGEQARYFFKHALIQDTAYQSLLKSTRQYYHQQVARVLEERFPDIKANQLELLAHHYTEAGQIEQAIPYWQQAGERATQRSAHAEVVAHIMRGLELLQTLSDTPARAQHELLFQTTLGPALVAIRGYANADVGTAYMRARELCQQLGETPQLSAVLGGLWAFHLVRAEYQTARELGEQLLTLAQRVQDLPALVVAHGALGQTFFGCGEWSQAQTHLEQSLLRYDPQHHQALTFLGGGEDPGVASRLFMACCLGLQGYPDQALERVHQAFRLARDLDHPFSLAEVLFIAAEIHQCREEGKAVQERAEALIALSIEQGFAFFVAFATIMRGWALTEEEDKETGIAGMREGLTAYRATGAEMFRPYLLALLAEAYGKVEQVEEGLSVVAEALDAVDKTGERFYEAELYRLKGELTLQQSKVQGPKSKVEKEAEEYFLKAIEIARTQQAKSLELRAAMSLARLWQSQGKTTEARELLAPVYNWFTEGFDTKDLQEAKALLEELRY
ncbi:MAG: adenylate/guanylate cyclase domain-containing protein [Candidatus Binatia bacterium]